MQASEHVPASLNEVISEIATILARGYMRHRNGRRLAPDSDRRAVHVAQVFGPPKPSFIHELTPPILRRGRTARRGRSP